MKTQIKWKELRSASNHTVKTKPIEFTHNNL
jgi:hypothetical protein